VTKTNFRDTICNHCERRIPAYEGVWEYGGTRCADEVECAAVRSASDARAMAFSGEQLRVMNDRDFVPTFPELVAWREKHWALVDARNADPAVAARRERMAAEDAALAAKGLKRCDRCGGAGRSEKWYLTGYTCYTCEGAGSIPA